MGVGEGFVVAVDVGGFVVECCDQLPGVAQAEARDAAGKTTAKAKKKMAPSIPKKRAPKRRKRSG